MEFFNYDLGIQFEIFAPNRRIELRKNYYISYSSSDSPPKSFELNNYEAGGGEPFVSCIEKCYKITVPNTATVAHIGYSSAAYYIDSSMQVLGWLTLSINQKTEQVLYFWYESSRLYDYIVDIQLEPKSKMDILKDSNDSRFQNLTLWSKNNKEGKEQISDIDILLTFKKETPLDSGRFEKVEHLISIINGKIIGENITRSGDFIDLTLD